MRDCGLNTSGQPIRAGVVVPFLSPVKPRQFISIIQSIIHVASKQLYRLHYYIVCVILSLIKSIIIFLSH